MSEDPCPSCGAPLGGRAGCQAAFDDLSARAWTSPVRGGLHNLVVDSYAMQHPEEYGLSAKSYVAHLTGLCCGVERPGDRTLYWKIPQSLDGSSSVQKPPLLGDRGRTTIAAPARAADEGYERAVRGWAADVWAAYVSQHTFAREWLAKCRSGRGANDKGAEG